ncbi:glycosyltransferase [Umezawaea tangerina]|uniref:glycosyltransferase n=1 Tax=Umezawaea tangerina TaxID=84725 RepID=UPI000A4B7D6A|nr:nucleotide disphospho-sugar-binding domain-containing protein [Umezawaea tangerina]
MALLTAGVMSPLVAQEDIDVLAAGPGPDVLIAEIARTTGADLLSGAPTLAVEAELFAGTRVDLGFEESLAAAGDWKPDVIVSEHYDFIGPLLGAALDVPVATLAYGPAMASELAEATSAVVESRYAARDLARRPSRWYLDTCPESLQRDGWQPPAGRLGLRPEAHRAPGTRAPLPAPPPRSRPRVLVTFGTVFAAPQVLNPLLLDLANAGLDLRVTTGLATSAADFDVPAERVSFVGFTPLDDLLRDVDLVLTHGGAGTTLGSLAAGIPLVVVPQGADQFVQADRVVAAGAGRVVEPGGSVARVALSVLEGRGFRAGAEDVAAQIAELPAPADVAACLATTLQLDG